MTTTVTSKGQITLPKKIRKQFHLNRGDRLEFLVDNHGNINLIPCKMSIRDLKGSVPKPDKIISINEMNDAIEKGAIKE